jgi:hypothetical protein
MLIFSGTLQTCVNIVSHSSAQISIPESLKSKECHRFILKLLELEYICLRGLALSKTCFNKYELDIYTINLL